MDTCFASQFGSCPLLWMFCGRALDRLINRLHQRALRSAYEDSECSYKELLSTDGSIAVHQRNLRVLAVEMYKLTKKLSPEFMWDIRRSKYKIHRLAKL